MKQYWQKLSARIDSRTLRERTLLFITAAALIIFLVFFFFLNPSYAQQKMLLNDIANKQAQMATVETEIAAVIVAHTRDPDAAERASLARIQADAQALKVSLTAMQQGMVPAERMSGLLEQILRGHRGLRLQSMRTLGESAPEPQEAAASAPAPVPASAPGAAPAVAVKQPPQLLHRHGVELVLQGSYPDMVAYMSALEGMQGQIFWGKASMAVDRYPNATLTLTVYTINLDKKWLKL
jgi:MSHA biogenesis protein MshJ